MTIAKKRDVELTGKDIVMGTTRADGMVIMITRYVMIITIMMTVVAVKESGVEAYRRLRLPL